MHTVARAINRLAADNADRHFILSCVKSESELPEFYNLLSLEVARLFMKGTLPFDGGDAAMNTIYKLWIGDVVVEDLLEPAYSIYLAFDAGEYSVDGCDSVERYTKPELRRILNSRQPPTG